MKQFSESPAILDYQGPPVESTDGRQYLKRMNFWRSICGVCLVVSLIGFVNILIAVIPLTGAILAAGLTLKYIWLAGRIEAGVGYATRHLALAMILLPIGFFGIYLVPILMESDMLKWHAEEDREVARKIQDHLQN